MNGLLRAFTEVRGEYVCVSCGQDYLREDLKRTCESLRVAQPVIPLGVVFRDGRNIFNLLARTLVERQTHSLRYTFIRNLPEDRIIYLPLTVCEQQFSMAGLDTRTEVTEEEFAGFKEGLHGIISRLKISRNPDNRELASILENLSIIRQ